MGARRLLSIPCQLKPFTMDAEFQQFIVVNYGEDVVRIFQQLLQGSQHNGDGARSKSPEDLLILALESYRQQHDRLLHEEEARFVSYPE